MPSHRAAPSGVTENPRKRPNLTPKERDQIYIKAQAGVSTSELVAEFNRDASTIRRTIRHVTTRGTTQESSRSGRPKILSSRQQKLIYRSAKKEPKIEYADLSKIGQFALPDGTLSRAPSKSTLYRYLKTHGIVNHQR